MRHHPVTGIWMFGPQLVDLCRSLRRYEFVRRNMSLGAGFKISNPWVIPSTLFLLPACVLRHELSVAAPVTILFLCHNGPRSFWNHNPTKYFYRLTCLDILSQIQKISQYTGQSLYQMTNTLGPWYFEAALHCVAQAGLWLLTFLCQPSEFGMTGMHDQAQLSQLLILSFLRNGSLEDN